MMRWLAIVLLCAQPALGAVCAEWVVRSISRSGFGICVKSTATPQWDNPADGVANIRLRITDADTWAATRTYNTAIDPNGDGGCVQVTDLEGGTAYLVDVGVDDGAWTDYLGCQTEVNATDLNSLGGAAIVDDGNAGGNEILQITTDAGDTPADPTLPTHTNTIEEIDPASDLDNTATVTVNGSDECTNLEALVESQATAIDVAGTNLIYGVKIPSGSVCRPEHESLDCYDFDVTIDDTNQLLIYSEYGNVNAHAPHLGMVAEDAPLASIEPNLLQPRACNLVGFASGSKNVRFQRVRVAEADFRLLDFPLVSVTAVSADSPPVLTLATALGANRYGPASNTQQLFARVPGLHSDYYHGAGDRVAVENGTAFWTVTTSPDTVKPGGSFSDGGSGSTGVVHGRLTANFTSATKVSGPLLTFPADHGYDNGFAYALDDITSGVATTSSNHQALYNANYKATYYASGMTGCADGLYVLGGVTSNTMTLESGPTGCTGGTIQRVWTVMLHDVVNVTGFTQQACIVDFASSTTAKLLLCWNGIDTAYVPDWTSETGTISGWLAVNSTVRPPLLDFTNCTDCDFEQGILDGTGGGSGMPYSANALVIDGGRDDINIEGSLIKTHFWMAQNPLTGVAHMSTTQGLNNSERFFSASGGSGHRFRNLSVISSGFFYQDQEIAAQATPCDITMQAIRYFTPDSRHADKAESGGMVSGFRHFAQWKNGACRLWFDGLSVSNLAHDIVSQPFIIYVELFIPTGDDGTHIRKQDNVTVTNSYLEGSSILGFGTGTVELSKGGGAKPQIEHFRALKIQGNIIKPWVFRSRPSNDVRNGPDYKTPFTPQPHTLGRFGELIHKYNTYLWPEGGPTAGWSPIADLGGSGSTGHVDWSKNIYVWPGSATGGNYTAFRCSSASNNWADCPAVRFSQFGTEPGANAVLGPNTVIAGFLDASESDPDVANSPCSAFARWQDGGGYAANFPLYSCTNGQSANTRMDAKFAAGTLEPLGDEGATPINILRAQGRILDVEHRVTASTIELTYQAPTTTGVCKAVAAAGAGVNVAAAATVFTATDTVGAYSRFLEITGLAAETTYGYLLACAGGVTLKGEVTTGAGS